MLTSLSYREKTLYASLAAELVVYGPYFFLHQQNSVNKVAGMIIAIIVLQIILQSVIAALTRNRVTDERDRLIELRGYRAGYVVLASLMVIGLGMLWFHATVGHFRLDGRMVGLHFLSAFFGMLVVADITKPPPRLWLTGKRSDARNTQSDSRTPRPPRDDAAATRRSSRRHTVIAIEQDKYSPSLETAFKVAIALGVPLERCFQYDPRGRR